MSRGTDRDCTNCEQHGRYRVPATQVCRGFDGETTFACDACHADALSLLEVLGRGKSFDRFGGMTFDPDRDADRLSKQLVGVLNLMTDGQPRTLRQISDATGYPEASISARLRDVRKEWGEDAMQAERVSDGLWTYRVLVRVAA